MTEPFIGSEAIASGRLNRHELRSRFSRIHPDVYGSTGTDLTAIQRAYAAWLCSRRRGVVAGQSASAMHKAKWVDENRPAQLLYEHRRPPPGILTWSGRAAPDEIQLIDGTPVTTPARTALDLATHYPVGRAVAAIDALARATRLNATQVELLAERYKGHRNIRRARHALSLVDAGAESPRETWLRLLVIKAGYPPPQTQIPVYGPYGELVAVVDMGWEEIKLALDYEGDHHRTNRRVFNRDIARHEALTTDLGWIDIRVTSENVPADILRRLSEAWQRACSRGEKIA